MDKRVAERLGKDIGHKVEEGRTNFNRAEIKGMIRGYEQVIWKEDNPGKVHGADRPDDLTNLHNDLVDRVAELEKKVKFMENQRGLPNILPNSPSPVFGVVG